ncbi:MAG TPA: hypothetical protein VF458_24355, partial [Ktedonobacteraceae bacterium]
MCLVDKAVAHSLQKKKRGECGALLRQHGTPLANDDRQSSDNKEEETMGRFSLCEGVGLCHLLPVVECVFWRQQASRRSTGRSNAPLSAVRFLVHPWEIIICQCSHSWFLMRGKQKTQSA